MVDRYADLVYSVPRNLGLDTDTIDDVFQTVWAAVFEQLDQLREPEKFKSWLLSITYRQAKRAVRRMLSERPVMLVLSEGDSVPVDGETAGELVEALDRRRLIGEALERIRKEAPSCYELIYELYLRERSPSYAEISGKLGLPMGSIGPTRGRCLDRLKRILMRIRPDDVY
jgi:RNA polymerase sigma factor (sigma-70 family)